MGRRARYIPVRLPEKLILIRKSMGLTQQGMLEKLELPKEILQTSISQYERGKIEPPIFVLLRYADVANVWLEVLLRDYLDLPDKLPSEVKHEGVPSTAPAKSGKRHKKSVYTRSLLRKNKSRDSLLIKSGKRT